MKRMLALLALVSVQAHASDDVTVETFEGQTVGTSTIAIHSGFLFDTKLSNGMVALATSDLQAHSGTKIYAGKAGTAIDLVTQDEDLYSWPGIGAWVSGAGMITLQADEYSETTGTDNPLPPVSIMAGAMPVYLSIGTPDHPHFITHVTFSSDSAFAIDDLTLGLEGIGPGTPEPATWALMLAGFGTIGASLRCRPRPLTAA